MMLTSEIINYILLFVIFAILILFWIIWSDVIGAGFEPTSSRIVKRMLEMAQVTGEDTLYDLGSGDGRIVNMAACTFKAQAVGIEADPVRMIWSRFRAIIMRCPGKVNFIWGNFFKVDLSRATVVTLFLSAKANQKLKYKLLTELQPGTRVVSYYWRIKGWKHIQEDKENHIYLYIIGQTQYRYD